MFYIHIFYRKIPFKADKRSRFCHYFTSEIYVRTPFFDKPNCIIYMYRCEIYKKALQCLPSNKLSLSDLYSLSIYVIIFRRIILRVISKYFLLYLYKNSLLFQLCLLFYNIYVFEYLDSIFLIYYLFTPSLNYYVECLFIWRIKKWYSFLFYSKMTKQKAKYLSAAAQSNCYAAFVCCYWCHRADTSFPPSVKNSFAANIEYSGALKGRFHEISYVRNQLPISIRFSHFHNFAFTRKFAEIKKNFRSLICSLSTITFSKKKTQY